MSAAGKVRMAAILVCGNKALGQGHKRNRKGFLQEPRKPLGFPGITRKRSHRILIKDSSEVSLPVSSHEETVSDASRH